MVVTGVHNTVYARDGNAAEKFPETHTHGISEIYP